MNPATEFLVEAQSSETAEFLLRRNVLSAADYFSLDKFRNLLSNPLLTPDWIRVSSAGVPLDLGSDFLWKNVQTKRLAFLDKARINEAVASGASVVLEGLDIIEPRLKHLCAEIDSLFPCVLCNCEAFFSQAGNEAYGGHCDSDDVLVMQISGTKRWRIHEPQARRYVGNSPLSVEQMGALVAEVTLEPGDLLFVRAGVPHQCLTDQDHSLHLSFDLCDRTPTADQISHVANQMFSTNLAPMHSSALSVLQRYSDLLQSPEMTQLVKEAESDMKQKVREFRSRIISASEVSALDRFESG